MVDLHCRIRLWDTSWSFQVTQSNFSSYITEDDLIVRLNLKVVDGSVWIPPKVASFTSPRTHVVCHHSAPHTEKGLFNEAVRKEDAMHDYTLQVRGGVSTHRQSPRSKTATPLGARVAGKLNVFWQHFFRFCSPKSWACAINSSGVVFCTRVDTCLRLWMPRPITCLSRNVVTLNMFNDLEFGTK